MVDDNIILFNASFLSSFIFLGFLFLFFFYMLVLAHCVCHKARRLIFVHFYLYDLTSVYWHFVYALSRARRRDFRYRFRSQ